MKKTIYLGFMLLLSIACDKASKTTTKQDELLKKDVGKQLLFSHVDPTISKLSFINKIEEGPDLNYYNYIYTYNGAGLATADFNNDGLNDLFLVSNYQNNKLYINKGDLKFEDVSESSKINEFEAPVEFGVTTVDINNDGFIDVYITAGGWKSDDGAFKNKLLINNGDLTFTEQAEDYGVADENRGIQSVFFDYDNDGFLDLYIANTPDIESKKKIVNIDQVWNDSKSLETLGCDKLYKNLGNGKFKDVSQKAGLLFDQGFGLNVQVSDVNNDGWLDIYVCNDFESPDLFYLNNQDGTFTESIKTKFKHTSYYSMGSDVADINNDGLMDVLTLDMNPEDYIRSKTTMGMASVSDFESMVANSYGYQYMHNMLQLNNGGNNPFSEISKMSGIANTDWSWSILSADFDLDNKSDVFVTNGVYRDVIHKDMNNKILQIIRQKGRKPTAEDFYEYSLMLPQEKLVNYFYKNNGDLTFTKMNNQWLKPVSTFSNGAVYVDLDDDGDLEIVVNNIDDKVTLLKNNAIENALGDFLTVKLNGKDQNKFGVGTKVELNLANGSVLKRELINTRGYLSSVSNELYFGLAKQDSILNLKVTWPDSKVMFLDGVSKNQLITLSYSDALADIKSEDNTHPYFEKKILEYKHEDPYFNDYNVQVLIPHKMSQTGPGVAVGDVNGDGLDDLYFGGGKGQSAILLLGDKKDTLRKKFVKDFELDNIYEDTAAQFFDFDGDGDLDLYVASGSYEFFDNPRLLVDRLYLNDGKGNFTRDNQLPITTDVGGVVTAADYDGDGDIDLFVGNRVVPGRYPYSPQSRLLVNESGKLVDATRVLATGLLNAGMISDAQWIDFNGDGLLDLITVGEWNGIDVYINTEGKLLKSGDYPVLKNSTGWWNALEVEDVDNDGDLDVIAGNLGLNYKFHASEYKPFHVYAADFDNTGTVDVFLAKNYDGKQVPVRGKGCSTQQMPHLSQKIPTYEGFASLDIKGVVGNKIDAALHMQVTEFRSGIFYNENNSYVFKPFENNVQRSPINSILFNDYNADGNKDLLLFGNNYMSEVETTRADAGIGSLLFGDGKGNFEFIDNSKSGLFSDKDVRSAFELKIDGKIVILVVNNNDVLEYYRID